MAVQSSLGTAYVTIEPDTKGFGKDAAKDIEGELGPAIDNVNQKITTGLAGAFKTIGVAVAGAGVAKFFKDSVGAATDLNEQVSKAQVVFGKSADKVLEFGKNAATSIGSSNREAVQAAGTFGNLLKSTGIAADKAADMSVNMVQLAGDLASFNNVPTADALDAIRSGLVGETEPLKRFAVNLNEATLKAEAMRLGLSDGKGVLDANAKAQAAYSIIMRQTSDAQGDYARTADSLANRQRTLSALFEDAKSQIGQALLPTMKELAGVATDLLPALTNTGIAIANIAAVAGSAVGPVASLLGSFAGSDMGQIAITAGALALAVEKLGIAGLVSSGNLDKLKASLLQIEPVMVVMALGVGALVQEYGRQQKAAEQNKARHEAMLKAFNDQAPLSAVNDQFKTLVETLSQVTGSSEDATAAVTDTASAMDIAGKLTEGDRQVLEKFHITQQDIADAINQGGGAYDALKKRIDDIAEGHRMAMVGGMKWIEQQNQAKDVLDALSKSQAESAAQRVADAQATVEAAVKAGLLTQAWLDGQLAAEQGKEAEQQWLDIQKAATPILEERKGLLEAQAAATNEAADNDKAWADAVVAARGRVSDADKKAMDSAADLSVEYGLSQDQATRLAKANDLTKDATQRHTDAEKALKDALDKVTDAQNQYLFVVGGAQATVDDTTRATRDLVKSLVDGADAAGRSGQAFQGNSDKAINNRDALQTLRERATDVIQGFDKLGYSADQAAQGQQQLAQDMYDTAIQAGATSDEADAVRDSILQIPIKHETDITAQADVNKANNDLDYAAREREAVIAVSLKAVGVSDELLQAVRLGKLTYNASGGMVPHTPGGSLHVVGEGTQDEAIVPMGPNFAANLERIVGPKRMAEVRGQGGSTQVVVNLQGAISDTTEARYLGRIVGETAADVLARRQVLTNVRVA